MSIFNWLQRRAKPPRDGKAILAERAKRGPDGEKTLVLYEHPALEKMSEVLKELARPWTDQATTLEDLEEDLRMAAVAWNLSLLPAAEREAAMNEPGWERVTREHRMILRKMITRKNELFPQNHRVVTDFYIARKGDEVAIDVMSTLDPNRTADLPDSEIEKWLKRDQGH